MLSKTVLFAEFLIVLVPFVSGQCQKSFMTICENSQDLKNLNDTINIQHLMIGSPVPNQNPLISINLNKDIPWSKLANLRSLYINHKISNLEVDKNIDLNCEIFYDLTDFTLYGNILQVLDAQQIPQISLKTLNLANNNIKELKRGALRDLPAKELDLCDNDLQMIPARTLPFRSKVIRIQNNSLTFIEPGSFGTALTHLWLDKNHLAYLEPKLFQFLFNLEFISLSGNYFYSVPNIQLLTKLQTLDLSSNRIKTIDEQILRNADKMVFLDLSDNQINDIDILRYVFHNKSEYLVVSLAFNKLENLETFDSWSKETYLVGKQAVLYYGNPFGCDRWNYLQKQLENHTSDCNLQFLADSRTPFCLSSDSTDHHKERFEQLSKKRAKNFYCKDYGGKNTFSLSIECSQSLSAIAPSDESLSASFPSDEN